MTALLLYLKHHCAWLWRMIEYVNGSLFRLRYGEISTAAEEILAAYAPTGYALSLVAPADLAPLSAFLLAQPAEHLIYFHPHAFDSNTLRRLHRNGAFLMMKATATPQQHIVGYFFLRCFFVGKAFHGFLVDSAHERQGIGAAMMRCNVALCKERHLRLFTTVAQDNNASLRASQNVAHILSQQQLDNGYLLVEWGA